MLRGLVFVLIIELGLTLIGYGLAQTLEWVHHLNEWSDIACFIGGISFLGSAWLMYLDSYPQQRY